jgi:hypothetical protein
VVSFRNGCHRRREQLAIGPDEYLSTKVPDSDVVYVYTIHTQLSIQDIYIVHVYVKRDLEVEGPDATIELSNRKLESKKRFYKYAMQMPTKFPSKTGLATHNFNSLCRLALFTLCSAALSFFSRFQPHLKWKTNKYLSNFREIGGKSTSF